MSKFFQTNFWIPLRRFVLPGLSILAGRKRYSFFEKIRANERLLPERIKDLQVEKLRSVLSNAKRHVPFYREKLAGQDLSNSEKIIDAFRALPIVTKAFIQENYDRMVSDFPYKKAPRVSYTGGSTGEPLKTLNDWAVYEEMEACTMRALSWGGWKIGVPVAMFWGGLRDLPSKKNAKTRIKEKINGRYFFGTYRYDDEVMREWVNFLSENRIQFVYGYASVLATLARFIRRKGIIAPRIKAAYSTAETLFREFRSDIEEVFQCKVFDQYGSREIISIASECEKGSMHIFTDMVYLEFLSGGIHEGPLRLITTTFVNPAMPFIRYDIGDYGFPKEGACACGRAFPLMEMGIGRRNDHIRLPNGKLIYPSYFIHLLDGIRGIRSFQFRQTDQTNITLRIQRGSDWYSENETLLKRLESKIQSDLGIQLGLDTQFVDNIPIPLSGKHRYVISEILKE